MARMFLLIATTLLLVSPQSFASKSRLSSLGQDVNGSLFIDDARNIFLNPAMINQLSGGLANFEFGASNSDNEPKAEGGLARQHGDFNVAVQLGRRSLGTIRQAQTRALYLAGNALEAPQNGLDVIIGSKTGLNWGLGVHYANSSSKSSSGVEFPDLESSSMAVRGGADWGKHSAYVGIDLKNLATNETAAGVKQKYDGKTSFDVGGVLKLEGQAKLAGTLEFRKADLDSGAGTRGTTDDKTLTVNFYNELPTKAGVMMFYTAGFRWMESKFDIENATADAEQSTLSLPLALGIELDAKEWMKMRASVRQNVIVDTQKDKNNANATSRQIETSNTDDTVVAAGAGFKLGDFMLDALIAGASDANGSINANTLLTHASLNYSF